MDNILVGFLNLSASILTAKVLEWLFPKFTAPDTVDGIMVEAVAGAFEISLFFIIAPSISLFINPVGYSNSTIMNLIFSIGFMIMTNATSKVLHLWTELDKRSVTNSNPTTAPINSNPGDY